MSNLVIQLLGLAGMLLGIACFQCKSSQSLLFMQAASNSLFVFHYFLLGAYGGCFSSLIFIIGNFLTCLKGRGFPVWDGIKWLLTAALAAVCIGTWEDVFSLLPCISTSVSILTNWTMRGKVIRFGKLLGVSPGWILYGLHQGSWFGPVSEGIAAISALISIFRYESPKKTDSKGGLSCGKE